MVICMSLLLVFNSVWTQRFNSKFEIRNKFFHFTLNESKVKFSQSYSIILSISVNLFVSKFFSNSDSAFICYLNFQISTIKILLNIQINPVIILVITIVQHIKFQWTGWILFKTDQVALNNFVEWIDETEWLCWKLYLLYKCKCKCKIQVRLVLLIIKVNVLAYIQS